jgi:VanZ family protein
MTLRRTSLWLPPLLYMLLIFYLSSQPAPLPVLTEHVWDKALHFPEYLVLCTLLVRALRGEGVTTPRAALLALLLTSAYGASDEFHQSFVPERTADVYDWVADSTGAAAAAAVFSTASRLRRRPQRSQPDRSNRPTAPAVRAARPSASAGQSRRAAGRE